MFVHVNKTGDPSTQPVSEPISVPPQAGTHMDLLKFIQVENKGMLQFSIT